MRILKILGLSVLALALLLGAAAYGLTQGWHLTRLAPDELSSLLRPHDQLLRPEGEGPFPAVLLFHGCGGVRRDASTWAAFFADLGFVALVVDSNKARGLDATTGCDPIRAAWPRERAGDVIVSLDYARSLPFVDPNRIVVAGWSSGAWTLMQLFGMETKLPASLNAAPELGLEGVTGAFFLSPFCGFPFTVSPWQTDLPVLILIGGADRPASNGECLALASRLREQGREIETHVYPGVGHAWDIQDIAPGHTHVYDAEATADSRLRVRAFLEKLR